MNKTTHEIPKCNLAKLRSKINVIQKKALKLGLEVPHFKVLRAFVGERSRDGKLYEVELVEVEVDDIQTHLAGWSFLCTIDHHEAGNVLRFNPKFEGEANTEKYRSIAPSCDHCKTQRRRNDTYIMINEEGETKQIGKSCIKDFLGHKSAEQYAQFCEFIFSISDKSGEYDRWDNGEELYDIRDILSIAAMFIRMEGYRSAKNFSGRTTREAVNFYLNASDVKYKEATGGEKPETNEDDKRIAQEAFDLVSNFEPHELVSDFNRNLNTLCKRGKVVTKDLGMVCYMPEMLMRTMAKRIEDAAKAKALKELAAKSEYLGSLKERMKMNLVYTRTVYLGSSQFGDSFLNFFNDEKGNVLVWKTSNALEDITQGSKVHVVGTVQEHSEYRGVKQTKITRCKVTKIEDASENNGVKEA